MRNDSYRLNIVFLAASALYACSAADGPAKLRGSGGLARGAATPAAVSSAAGSGSSSTSTITGGGGPVIQASTPAISNQGKVCASATVQTVKAPPTVYFVIDGSGSMCADFGGTTRWQALRNVLLEPNNGLLYRLQGSVQFGVTLYDGTVNSALSMLALATGGSGTPPCAVAASRGKMFGECPGLVESPPPTLNNAMAIDMAYPQRELGGSTPTDRALGPVMDRLIPMVGMQSPDGKPVGDIYVI
ncbi:MAG TPA: VWA domain-containing protein, partial [Polyangiales bacterium]|nr:VWA domain-containing protein [Polyangiales bacterium]